MSELLDDPVFLGPTVSEARLISVLDTAVDGIIVVDNFGRIMLYNHACERLFGYMMSEVVGRNIIVIMPPEYAEAHDAYLHNYHTTGVRKIIGIGREVRGQHKDGSVFPIELSVGETVTPDGRQFIGIIRDLRPRKEAEQRMNQLQADLLHMARVSAMDEMGAALAHELNQPLTAVNLYLQVARKAGEKAGAPFPRDVQDILDKALKEAARAAAIIQRMRQFVEKRDPERRFIDIAPLVDDAVELTLLGQRHSIRVVRDYAMDSGHAVVDPVQIQQVVVNLMRNAMEALRDCDSPKITVRTRNEGADLILIIADNGPGIPESVVPSLFKAFSTTKRTGMGLGLAISKTIAQNHGGDLTVEPGGGGTGAAFFLRLPRAEPPVRLTQEANQANVDYGDRQRVVERTSRQRGVEDDQ